jgi:hypothetical protein
VTLDYATANYSHVLNVDNTVSVVDVLTDTEVKSGGLGAYGVKDLRVKKGSIPIADVSTDLTSDRDWSNVTTDSSSNKSLSMSTVA